MARVPICLLPAGVIPEAEVSITVEKGVNTSTRDLVLAAISVMKGRKARPDTKRLCNWVNRKYGRAVQDVVSEIDDLCNEGILEKVRIWERQIQAEKEW